MSAKIVYLISGANRGIGYAFAAAIAARTDTVVFAGARDSASQSLKDLAAKHSNVNALKLTSGNQTDNEIAITEIKRIAVQLDVIIANAGISNYYGPLATTLVSEFRGHWEVNTLGTVVLFQAAQELLLASPTKAPVFALVSSTAGSMGHYIPLGATAYSSSKAAANFLIVALHNEVPGLIAFALNPGWVATDMGNTGAHANGMPLAPVSIEDSVAGMLSRIDGATRETTGGKFWNFKATRGNSWDVNTDEVPW